MIIFDPSAPGGMARVPSPTAQRAVRGHTFARERSAYLERRAAIRPAPRSGPVTPTRRRTDATRSEPSGPFTAWRTVMDKKGRPVELVRLTHEAQRQWDAAERAGRTPRANRYEQDYSAERTRANPRGLPTRTITEVR